jgi:hypothetical protein
LCKEEKEKKLFGIISSNNENIYIYQYLDKDVANFSPIGLYLLGYEPLANCPPEEG